MPDLLLLATAVEINNQPSGLSSLTRSCVPFEALLTSLNNMTYLHPSIQEHRKGLLQECKEMQQAA